MKKIVLGGLAAAATAAGTGFGPANTRRDSGHPEDLVERPRSIGRRHPQVMGGAASNYRLPQAGVIGRPVWSETDGLAALDRAVGKLYLGESRKAA